MEVEIAKTADIVRGEATGLENERTAHSWGGGAEKESAVDTRRVETPEVEKERTAATKREEAR